MALTRAQVEQVLISRLAPVFAAAGMAVTYAGSNADLNDPIGYAIRQCGSTVTTITAVADADLAAISSDDYDKLLDLAEYRALENVLTHLDDVDIRVGPRSESFSQLAKQVEKRVERLQKRLEKEHGLGLGSPQWGYLTHSFAEHDDDSPEAPD